MVLIALLLGAAIGVMWILAIFLFGYGVYSMWKDRVSDKALITAYALTGTFYVLLSTAVVAGAYIAITGG